MQNKLGQVVKILIHGNKIGHIRRHLTLYQLRQKSIRLFGVPFNLHLETCTMCNLRCPFCPTGNGTSKLKKEILVPDTFERIWAHLPLKYIDNAFLYDNGEPFLNPHIHDYVRRFRKAGKFTQIHSNFSVKEYDEDFMAEIVNSGLDQLFISIDGATEETYSRYRVGGNFERVLRNMKRLAEVKRRLLSETPELVYKVLLNRYTEPEVEMARQLAREVGASFEVNSHFAIPGDKADEWRASSLRPGDGKVAPTRYGAPDGKSINTCCRQLWETLVINANGDVFACCAITDPAHALGNLAEEPFWKIWNNYKMRYLRRYVTDVNCPAPDFPNLCECCFERFCTYGQGNGR